MNSEQWKAEKQNKELERVQQELTTMFMQSAMFISLSASLKDKRGTWELVVAGEEIPERRLPGRFMQDYLKEQASPELIECIKSLKSDDMTQSTRVQLLYSKYTGYSTHLKMFAMSGIRT